MPHNSKQIPGWFRQISSGSSEQPLSFEELFSGNSSCWDISNINPDSDYSMRIFHQNLYEQPASVEEINADTCFVISANLIDVDDVERICLFEEHVQRASLSFGCFTLPSGTGGFHAALKNRDLLWQIERLPCSIVLIDTQEIVKVVPKLPFVTPNDSNDDRVLQTAICGLMVPVATTSIISVDCADLRHLLNSHKLFGMGVGFMDNSDNVRKEAEAVCSNIFNQIAPGVDPCNAIGSGWIAVCSNSENFSMTQFAAVADVMSDFSHEDADPFITLTFDGNLEDNVMVTSIIGLV